MIKLHTKRLVAERSLLVSPVVFELQGDAVVALCLVEMQ
jgi:hypothetical protein